MAPADRRDFASDLFMFRCSKGVGSAKKRSPPQADEHFETIRNPPNILADHGHLDAYLR
jgi:hypothetical protein